jgi:Flp pilus assembly protein TadD
MAWNAWCEVWQTGDFDPDGLAEAHGAMRVSLEEAAESSDDPKVLEAVGNWLIRAHPIACRDPKAAVGHLQRAKSLSPSDPQVTQRLAGALWMSGRKDEAITMFEEAIAAAPPEVAKSWRRVLKKMRETPR